MFLIGMMNFFVFWEILGLNFRPNVRRTSLFSFLFGQDLSQVFDFFENKNSILKFTE